MRKQIWSNPCCYRESSVSDWKFPRGVGAQDTVCGSPLRGTHGKECISHSVNSEPLHGRTPSGLPSFVPPHPVGTTPLCPDDSDPRRNTLSRMFGGDGGQWIQVGTGYFPCFLQTRGKSTVNNDTIGGVWL